MLFTMTVPFLEVALHTCTEVMRRPGAPPEGWVQEVAQADELGQSWVGVLGRFLLPIISLIFAATFWIIGLIASYWLTSKQDGNITDCLTIHLV